MTDYRPRRANSSPTRPWETASLPARMTRSRVRSALIKLRAASSKEAQLARWRSRSLRCLCYLPYISPTSPLHLPYVSPQMFAEPYPADGQWQTFLQDPKYHHRSQPTHSSSPLLTSRTRPHTASFPIFSLTFPYGMPFPRRVTGKCVGRSWEGKVTTVDNPWFAPFFGRTSWHTN